MRRSSELMDMATDELMAAYENAFKGNTVPRWHILAMHHELQRRKALAPEAYQISKQLLTPEELLDPTGTKLTPSFHGKECLGNGEWPGYECCCDECDYFQVCFPEN